MQKSEPASYNRLKKMAKKYLDQKTKDLKFDARHHRAASGAPIGRKRRCLKYKRRQNTRIGSKDNAPKETHAVSNMN